MIIPLGPSVKAVPGSSVDDPSNVWAPYAPQAPNLQFNFYAGQLAEFNDFMTGHLDLTDWTQPSSQFSSYDANPDFLLSPGQGQYGMFGLDFNYGASTWSAWGCDFQHGTSACGIEIREGIAHLIDRQHFVTDGPLQGAGQAIADPSPPAKDPTGSSLSTQNSWDTLSGKTVAGLTQPPTISAFHVAPSPGGFAVPGSPDFCAARDHFIAAGIGLKDDDQDCVIDPSSPGLANILAHPIRFMVRNDDPIRDALGTGLVNALDQLFGASVVSPTFGSIVQLRPIVFISAPLGATNDWDMYTFGWNLGGPFPDHLFPLYASVFASDQCGGQQDGQTLNYGFVCIPTFDNYANAAASTADINQFKADTLNAFNEFGKHVANIPVYSLGIRIAALRSLAGVVNQRGNGYSNSFTILNGHNNTGYTPANSIYKFGGGSNTIRWGQKQGTSELNPFSANSLWELNVISEVYDTILQASPVEPASIFCWMCDSYTTSLDAQGNTHFLIEMRQDIRWQDGVPMNASDVKFSLLNMRDVPAADFASNVALLLGVTIFNPFLLDIKMEGQSVSHVVNLSGVPIIPRHIWELKGDRTYGDVGIADPAKTSPSYDPIASGTFVGSGPYICRSVFASDLGKIGTGCSVNSDLSRGGQSVGPGGSIFLQAYDRTHESGNTDPFLQYMRSYNPAWATDSSHSGLFQEFSWADRFNNDTVTIRDIAGVAACFGKTSTTGCVDYSYWLKSAFHPLTPNTIGSEVTIVASHMDETWVSPYSWSGDQSSQPGNTLENIVPFTP
jgi:hypothetical protein